MPEAKSLYGFLLRSYRLRAGMTLSALAQKLGLSTGYLSDVERGNRLALPGEKSYDIGALLSLPGGDTASLYLAPYVAPALAACWDVRSRVSFFKNHAHPSLLEKASTALSALSTAIEALKALQSALEQHATESGSGAKGGADA